MITPDFPGNSKRAPAPEPRVVESVVQNEAVSRKKSVGRRLKETLIGGDSNTVVQYVVLEVLVPKAKEMITEAITEGFERLVYGDGRGVRRGSSRPLNRHTDYSRLSRIGNNPISRADRDDRPMATVQTRGIDEILLATRIEAETVLERMGDLIEEYGQATVADLYSLVNWSSSHVDHNWGWTTLGRAHVQRVRGNGYTIDLSNPVSLK